MIEKEINDAALALKKEKAREYQKAYRITNAEIIKARLARYYAARSETIKAKNIAYQTANS